MTIKQKLIVFASSMVLVAMVIATLVSNVVFNNMLTNSAVRYLETASYSAQELLKARREQMHVAISWADEMEGMPTALARRDTAALEEQLRRVIQACPFLAFGSFWMRRVRCSAAWMACGRIVECFSKKIWK